MIEEDDKRTEESIRQMQNLLQAATIRYVEDSAPAPFAATHDSALILLARTAFMMDGNRTSIGFTALMYAVFMRTDFLSYVDKVRRAMDLRRKATGL